jgi:hypothetical protein
VQSKLFFIIHTFFFLHHYYSARANMADDAFCIRFHSQRAGDAVAELAERARLRDGGDDDVSDGGGGGGDNDGGGDGEGVFDGDDCNAYGMYAVEYDDSDEVDDDDNDDSHDDDEHYEGIEFDDNEGMQTDDGSGRQRLALSYGGGVVDVEGVAMTTAAAAALPLLAV